VALAKGVGRTLLSAAFDFGLRGFGQLRKLKFKNNVKINFKINVKSGGQECPPYIYGCNCMKPSISYPVSFWRM
jgi:hypothetical protein